MSALILSVFLLLVALSLQVICQSDKEGFLTYVVYGPAVPDLRLQGPAPWRRPYWGSMVAPDLRRGWRRRYWYGPCPGPWCPYA